MSPAALALAALAAAGPAASVPLGDLDVEGARVVYDAARERYRLEGAARVRRGAIVLRADRAEVDARTGEAEASGHVLLTDSARVIAADAIRAELGGGFVAEGVVAFLKARPLDLTGVSTLDEAHLAGTNRLSFSARRVTGGAARGGALAVEDARLTLCDCGPGKEPTWALRARSADVIPGDRAILTWPVLYVHAVPVLPLPWLYVPLGERQTGLLFPEIASTSATGFAFSQPLYVTLGEHADLTLSPGWAFGPSRKPGDTSPAVSGPTGRLELRWAPAEGAEGRGELTWVDDRVGEPGGADGHRFGLALRHHQGTLESLALEAELALDEDGVLHRDLTSSRLSRAATYQRSALLASRRVGPALLEAGSAYLQPLQPAGAAGAYGLAGADVRLSDPLGWASATVPAAALGPVLASGRAGVTYRSPLHGGTDLGLRPETARLDGRLELELPLVVGEAVALSPFVRGAALTYSGAQGGQVAWGVVGAAASTEVARRFGELRHAVGARAEWRLGSATVGDAPAFPAFDAFDRVQTPDAAPADCAFLARQGCSTLTAAPPGRFQQLRLAVDTRLSLGGVTLAKLTVGRDFDLEAGRAAEAFASGAVGVGPVHAEVTTRFPSLDRPAELGARLDLGDRKGNLLHAEYHLVRGSGGGLQTAGLDVLFDPRPRLLEDAAGAVLGGQLALGPALLGYEARFPGRSGLTQARCGANPTRNLGATELYEQVGRLGWESPCHCFRAAVQVEVDACGNFAGVKGKIEIARTGEQASGAAR
ncbi:MAG: LPS-assembly protein LptD [Anaeromyxobacteraceae bacterium]